LNHRCLWPGCNSLVENDIYWGCKPHWAMLPVDLKKRYLATKKDSPHRISVMAAIQEWIAKHSRPPAAAEKSNGVHMPSDQLTLPESSKQAALPPGRRRKSPPKMYCAECKEHKSKGAFCNEWGEHVDTCKECRNRKDRIAKLKASTDGDQVEARPEKNPAVVALVIPNGNALEMAPDGEFMRIIQEKNSVLVKRAWVPQVIQCLRQWMSADA
jgi:hypothetical protein